MNDVDPYKHIRALALSMANIDRPVVPESLATALAGAAPPAPGPRNDRGVRALAAQLKAARERRELTQRELGGLAGVPQSHISKIESGAVDLRLSSLLALAAVLDLDLVLADRGASEREGRSGRTADATVTPLGPAKAAPRNDQQAVEPAALGTGTQ